MINCDIIIGILNMDLDTGNEIVFPLYNDSVHLLFDANKHLYTVDGKKVDGTTGILGVIAKPALMYWAVNVTIAYLQKCFQAGEMYDEVQIKKFFDGAKSAHRKKSSEAADIGTMVHNWIRDHIAGKKPKTPVNTIIKNAINQFLSWEKDHNVKFLESEKVVYSREHNYAGTLDFIAEVDGEIKIGDFKTSTGIWDEYWYQLAAYQQAYMEEYPGLKIAGGIIVRCGKDGSLEVAERTDYEKNVIAFNSALALYRRINELKNEKPPYIPKKKWSN